MHHRAKGADPLLKVVKWKLTFGTIFLRSECRHYIFRSNLVNIFRSIVGKSVFLTVIKYHISCLMH